MRLILDLTDDNNSVLDLPKKINNYVLDFCTTFLIPQLDKSFCKGKKHSTFGHKWIHYLNGVTHKYALA